MFVQPNVVLAADTEKVLYNVESPKGVFIQHVNGSLFTTNDWTAGGYSNDEANGVAVINDACKFVIAKVDIGYRRWQNTATLIEGIPTYVEEDDAETDFNGVTNTALMTDSPVQSYCTGYTFPNGQKGYVGAAGE